MPSCFDCPRLYSNKPCYAFCPAGKEGHKEYPDDEYLYEPPEKILEDTLGLDPLNDEEDE